MGACCDSTNDNRRNFVRISQIGEYPLLINQIEQALRSGNQNEIQSLLNNIRDQDIDEYIFGQNKKILLEYVIVCPNPAVVDMIMRKGADINKEEYQTGNTALFLSALDLKVEFVQALLKYNPNFQHKNHKSQNIFDFLTFCY